MTKCSVGIQLACTTIYPKAHAPLPPSFREEVINQCDPIWAKFRQLGKIFEVFGKLLSA